LDALTADRIEIPLLLCFISTLHISTGAGIGAGFPGLQLGFGVGAGCGIGIGFGYGFGKGVAYDENGRYSNIRRPFQNSRNLPYE
jgi:hypothetical protein